MVQILCFWSLHLQPRVIVDAGISFVLLFICTKKFYIDRYRKIPNIRPWLMNICKYIFGDLYTGTAYIQRPFCVTICERKLLKSITVQHHFMCDRQDLFSASRNDRQVFKSHQYTLQRRPARIASDRHEVPTVGHDVRHWQNIHFRRCL